jgi:uncharacterized Zn finger protein
MARSFDDRWRRFPPSVPLPADNGIVHSKPRGVMADTWWSRRFVDVLESYGLGTRMQRGRRYAHTGQVLTLDVRDGLIVSQVQGSRRTPYVVTIGAPQPTARQWAKVDDVLCARIGFVARLLAGEVPPDLEDAFASASVALFPRAWSDLTSHCSCPDWENPCKHIAAVLYLFADRLDDDPWLVLAWRGRTRDEILEPLRAKAHGGRTVDASAVAPWWPFTGGPLPSGLGERGVAPIAPPPDTADDVLTRLPLLPVDVRGTPVTDLLAHAYDAISENE